jgi:bacillithiol synthase
MENPEWPECLWRKVQDGIFAVQRSNGNIISLLIPVDIRRFPGIRKLAADYAFAFSSLAPFFSGDPSSPSSWTTAIARAQTYPRSRDELSAIIAKQLERRDAPRQARDAAARLSDPKTVSIVTGQQAGLFGGPLYTLYKAVTAAKLAARVSKEHHVPAVPVFWVESEDHDWNEVASCFVLDADFRRAPITLPPPPGAGRTPIGLLSPGESVTRAIDELAATVPATDFTRAVVDDLRQAYRPDVSMADAFARWLEQTLSDLGVVVFDCSDPTAKPLVSGIFAQEISQPGKTWQLAGEAGRRLTASGYHAQVEATSAEGASALFRLNGARTAIEASEAPRFAQDVRSRPEVFSPNVLLRPIVEDALFPTICYVSGPNELAYLAQLRQVYEHFGVPMPLFFPRASATILDSASYKFLARHDLPVEELQARDEAALNRLLAASLPQSVDEALKTADEAVSRAMAGVIETVPAIDPTLEGAAKSTLGKLQHDLSTLRGKVISAAKRRDETMRRQFLHAQALAFPDGIPQERALSTVSLLNRFGPALVQRLVDDVPLDLGHHWVLTL